MLAPAESGFGQYSRQAKDAVQRRPNLMTHVGQKVLLSLGVHFGGGDGVFEGLLGSFQLGDVAVEAQHLGRAIGLHKKPFHAAEPRHPTIEMSV